MPNNGPPVTQPFIAILNTLTWEAGGHLDLVTGRGSETDYSPVVEADSGAWGWSQGDGITMSHDTFLTLKNATANADGSYTATGGVSYWLVLAGTVATAQAILP